MLEIQGWRELLITPEQPLLKYDILCWGEALPFTFSPRAFDWVMKHNSNRWAASAASTPIFMRLSMYVTLDVHSLFLLVFVWCIIVLLKLLTSLLFILDVFYKQRWVLELHLRFSGWVYSALFITDLPHPPAPIFRSCHSLAILSLSFPPLIDCIALILFSSTLLKVACSMCFLCDYSHHLKKKIHIGINKITKIVFLPSSQIKQRP